MDLQRLETVTLMLLRVRDDLSDVMGRLSALESSHGSLCVSHMELEDSHVSLNAGGLNGDTSFLFFGIAKYFDTVVTVVS